MENKKLGDLGESKEKGIVEETDISDDEIEQKSRVLSPHDKKVGVTGEPSVHLPKQKKVLTEKQKETLAKGRELRDLKRKERIAEKQRQEEEQKRELEDKIVKKAIAIKKKQIRKQKVIEPTSSEEDYDDDDGRSPSIPHKRYEPPPPPPRKPKVSIVRPKAPPQVPIAPRQPKLVFL